MKMYAARDKDGKLFLYFNKKPKKHTSTWYNETDDDYCELSQDLTSVKWEDEEPTEVEFDKVTLELKLKCKVSI